MQDGGQRTTLGRQVFLEEPRDGAPVVRRYRKADELSCPSALTSATAPLGSAVPVSPVDAGAWTTEERPSVPPL